MEFKNDSYLKIYMKIEGNREGEKVIFYMHFSIKDISH